MSFNLHAKQQEFAGDNCVSFCSFCSLTLSDPDIIGHLNTLLLSYIPLKCHTLYVFTVRHVITMVCPLSCTVLQCL